MDLQWMHLARIQQVASSLEQLYGIQATNAEDLRQPCAPEGNMAAAWYTFVPFRGGYTGRWQCLRTSPPSLSRALARVQRLPCACKGPWMSPSLPPHPPPPPPSPPPPSAPALPPLPPSVVLTMTASGSVSSYTDTASLQGSIASAAGVDASAVTIDVAVSASSVLITATIAVPASTTAAAVQTSLSSRLGTAASASALLSVTIESDPTWWRLQPTRTPFPAAADRCHDRGGREIPGSQCLALAATHFCTTAWLDVLRACPLSCGLCPSPPPLPLLPPPPPPPLPPHAPPPPSPSLPPTSPPSAFGDAMTHVDAADAALRAALQRVRKLPIAAVVFVAALLLALAVFFLARDTLKLDERAEREPDYHPATSYFSPREHRAQLNELQRSNELWQKSLRSPVARSRPPFTTRSPIAERSPRHSPGYAVRTPRGTPLQLL